MLAPSVGKHQFLAIFSSLLVVPGLTKIWFLSYMSCDPRDLGFSFLKVGPWYLYIIGTNMCLLFMSFVFFLAGVLQHFLCSSSFSCFTVLLHELLFSWDLDYFSFYFDKMRYFGSFYRVNFSPFFCFLFVASYCSCTWITIPIYSNVSIIIQRSYSNINKRTCSQAQWRTHYTSNWRRESIMILYQSCSTS